MKIISLLIYLGVKLNPPSPSRHTETNNLRGSTKELGGGGGLNPFNPPGNSHPDVT